MTVRKAAGKKQSSEGETEARVVALAEQLGWCLGTVRGKADGLLASDAVQQEVARIRDGAAELMEHVNRAGATAKQKAAGAIVTAIDAAPSVGASARKAVASASTSARWAVASASTSAKQMATSAGASAKKAVVRASKAAQKAVKSATKKAPTPLVQAAKKRSGGTVDAPGKRHRKPPPQEKVNKRMGEPVGKQVGQKQFQPGHGARRG